MTSDIELLPHQQQAINEFLSRRPLRYLLADDFGTGKTITAALYLKELIHQGRCQRAIIVVPDGLFEQWWRELHDRLGINIHVYDFHQMGIREPKNLFLTHQYVLLPMGHAARSSETMSYLRQARWDLAIIDHADRLTAKTSRWVVDAHYTLKLKLGQLISETAENLLLLTETPESYTNHQLRTLLALLDEEHFSETQHNTSPAPDKYMRCLQQEDLSNTEGKPLLPNHQFHAVTYPLTPQYRHFYQQILHHAREELEIANTMDFCIDHALTNSFGYTCSQLIRSTTSSPNEILTKLRGLADAPDEEWDFDRNLDYWYLASNCEEHNEEATLKNQYYFENFFRSYVSIPEITNDITLKYPIDKQLLRLGDQLTNADRDQKWYALRAILDQHIQPQEDTSRPQKIIIFANFYHTIDYLTEKLSTYFSGKDSVNIVRKYILENEIYDPFNPTKPCNIFDSFTNDPNKIVLLLESSTYVDPALQNVHLLVNYDMPWDLRQLQTRISWIHRIGQQHTCHIWNFIAEKTIEEDILLKLLDELHAVPSELQHKLLHVLGTPEAFNGHSLDNLMMYAIQYSDIPQVKQRIHSIIEASIHEQLERILRSKQ
ncbi:MAG: DEAD/DEAH box helicase [Corynebacterium sp.]|nr:DEAD/DEAH box helicase [Corynebacterium sp.]